MRKNTREHFSHANLLFPVRVARGVFLAVRVVLVRGVLVVVFACVSLVYSWASLGVMVRVLVFSERRTWIWTGLLMTSSSSSWWRSWRLFAGWLLRLMMTSPIRRPPLRAGLSGTT